MSRAVIFANGSLPEPDKARDLLLPDDLILCADGGLLHARALGVRPHAVIGDMDSLSREILNELTQSEVQIVLHPADKDKTDLELALDHAFELGVKEILIVAGLGKRLDQTLSNIGLMMGDGPSTLKVRIDDGIEEVFFCKDQAEIHGRKGDVVSLIPWNGVVGGVRTEGLRWPLVDESLYSETSRGISNVMQADVAQVSITFGLLLILHRRETN